MMVKCKIIQIINKEYCYETDVYHSVIGTFTDWEEVSEEDFYILKNYFQEYQTNMLLLIEENQTTVNQLITKAKAIIKEKEEQRIKKEQQAKKREKTRLENIKKKELKLLSQLEKKYEKTRSI